MLTVLRVHAGVADWYPYPSLNAPAIDPLLVGACLLLVTPALVWRRPSSAD